MAIPIICTQVYIKMWMGEENLEYLVMK